jgi:hypothetical protein
MKPPKRELQMAEYVASCIWNEFGLDLPEFRSDTFDYLADLPSQSSSDSINCGVYVCYFMVFLMLNQDGRIFFKDNLPASIDQCRLLLMAWILRGEIFFVEPLYAEDDQVSFNL